MYFTITTNPETAEKIKKQCEWDDKYGVERSYVLGSITRYKGLESDYSVVQIKAKGGRKINQKIYFF